MKKIAGVLSIVGLLALAQPVYAGWAMLTPPTDQNGAYVLQAPMNRWIYVHAFDDAKTCEYTKYVVLKDALAETPEQFQQDLVSSGHAGSPMTQEMAIQGIRLARCIQVRAQ